MEKFFIFHFSLQEKSFIIDIIDEILLKIDILMGVRVFVK